MQTLCCFTYILSFNLVEWPKAPIHAGSLLSLPPIGSLEMATVILQVLPFEVVDGDAMPSGVTLGALCCCYVNSLEHR